MHHIVLLGDSVFDNGLYVNGEPDVAGHLRNAAPADWQVTLCAVDGNRTDDVTFQLKKVPKDASHLFLSVGGNDALDHSHLLTDFVTPGTQILEYLANAVEEFGMKYRSAIKEISALGKPFAVFTIYNGNLEAVLAKAARAAVAVFNDTIYQIAGESSIPVIELRHICTEPSDYVNQIEPSSIGGKKIALSMLEFVQSTAHL